jgi:hypothetical protein
MAAAKFSKQMLHMPGLPLHHLWQIHFKWRKQTITFIQSAPTGVVRGDYQRLALAAWRALAHSSGIS